MTTNQTHPLSTRRRVISTDPFVYEVPADGLRVGEQLHTAEGWQTIIGMMVVQPTNQVVVWTPEHPDDDFPATEGWQYHFGDPVQTRPTAEQRAAAGADCPKWCIDHYTGVEGDTCHSGRPLSVLAADVYTGKPVELAVWMERRYRPIDFSTETVGVLEVRTLTEDIELTPAAMRQLASKLIGLADLAEKRQ